MKLTAEIDGNKYAVALRREGTCVFAEIEDRRYEVEAHGADTDAYLIISNGRVFDCRVEGHLVSGKTAEVVVGTKSFPVTLNDPKRLRGSSNTGAHADAVVRIAAPMPGKVVRVLVEAGQQIEAGAGVVVVEAMKMQNELKSPKAGSVVSLNVKTGETVNAGDVLAVIE